MGRLDGKVAVVSGAARGQGRSHAETLARAGASIVAFDICRKLDTSLTPGATEDDLAETRARVEATDHRCLTDVVDARDLGALQVLADQAVEELGRVDILCINHGIWTVAPNSWELEEDAWAEAIDINLTGAWKVAKAFVPKIIAGGEGGAIVLTGSTAAVQPQPSAVAYTAAKHGIIGIMRVLAKELGAYNIRVNAVNPGGIETAMLLEGGTVEKSMEYQPEHISHNRAMLPIEWQPASSISDAILWLVSDDARYVTGAMIPVDSGWTAA